MKEPDKTISRRLFIGGGMASLIGAGLGCSKSVKDESARVEAATEPIEPSPPPAAVEVKPQIKSYRPLGKTGWNVSDVSFGNAGMQDPAMLEYAMERGINYVDTARQYYDMEIVIGKIFPQKRDKLFVTTKLEPEVVTADVTVETLMTALEDSIKRLNTDYVDSCLIHSVGDPNLGDRTRIENQNIYTMFDKAKQQGKIRFWGASSHGPKMMEDFNWLMDNTDIDMIMPGMNYMTRGLEPVLARARAKQIAVVAMKSMSAARKIDYSAFMTEGRTIRQALLRWMLAQPNIDTVSLTMRSFEDIDEFVGASGKPGPSGGDRKVMEEYGRLLDRDYCRPGCDGCLTACPANVPIHDILRYRLYFNNYGREKYAMGLYAALPASRNAHRCASCTAPCQGSCPHDIPIKSKLAAAHRELTV